MVVNYKIEIHRPQKLKSSRWVRCKKRQLKYFAVVYKTWRRKEQVQSFINLMLQRPSQSTPITRIAFFPAKSQHGTFLWRSSRYQFNVSAINDAAKNRPTRPPALALMPFLFLSRSTSFNFFVVLGCFQLISIKRHWNIERIEGKRGLIGRWASAHVGW